MSLDENTVGPGQKQFERRSWTSRHLDLPDWPVVQICTAYAMIHLQPEAQAPEG